MVSSFVCRIRCRRQIKRWRIRVPKHRFHVWIDLALLAHLCQALVPLVDSGANRGCFNGTASRSSRSISTTSSACLLRTQSNQESLMRSKLPGYTSRRLHSCCPCMLLQDSMYLRCPRHAISHRSIGRRGGTRRRLLTSSSWLLWHVVCFWKSCAPPRRFRMFIDGQQQWLPASASGHSWDILMFVVQANFVGAAQKKFD